MFMLGETGRRPGYPGLWWASSPGTPPEGRVHVGYLQSEYADQIVFWLNAAEAETRAKQPKPAEIPLFCDKKDEDDPCL